jgi:1,4-alpha-glucan branching enzyme
MSQGYLCLFLHAHLPYVHHPEHEHHLEEQWLFEAITETYIPLLGVLERCVAAALPFRLTMSLTPPLVSMLTSELLRRRYVRYIDKLIELSEKEIKRTRRLPDYRGLAKMYNRLFVETKEKFVHAYKQDIVSAFKRFQESGILEIVASCATHGFLPNLGVNPASVKAQIDIGIDRYKKTFGRPPKGFWLPECGYFRGVDALLKDAGIDYFFLDSHGVINAEPRPKYGVYAPIYCASGVAAFGRDWESSKQVWSAQEGYPGDPDYREYYRDIGHELDFEYIKPYIHPEGIRINTGLKYWRITGATEQKLPYIPEKARKKAAIHAGNFLDNRISQIQRLFSIMDREPIVVAPYDAELFGHWWYEGPQWIEFVIQKVSKQDAVRLCTPSEYLARHPVNQRCDPPLSSWGYKGYSEYWLDGSNDWLCRHLHAAGKRMTDLAARFKKHLKANSPKNIHCRALNQAARELLLAQSSDWPFIMKSGTMTPYAHKRVKSHIGRFTKLYENLRKGCFDEDWLAEVERRDDIFSDMKCAKYYLPEDAGKKRKTRKNLSRAAFAKKRKN